MSASSRLPVIASTLSLGAAAVALSTSASARRTVARVLGDRLANNTLKILALLYAILNFKNLPFIWHYRVFRGILYQIYFNKYRQQPRHLFAPLVTSSYNTLYDTDYNFHKSNSTYFSDLDVSRAHAVGCLIRTGLDRLNNGDEEGLPQDNKAAPGSYVIALGGVGCMFHRQIEPFQAFEIHTRVLAWDRKWLYLVSHVVRKGAIKPEAYVLQPWKKGRRRQAKRAEESKQEHQGTQQQQQPEKKNSKPLKRDVSPYLAFANANRDKVREENPGTKFGELGSLLGEKWKGMSDEEKAVYGYKPTPEPQAQAEEKQQQQLKDEDVMRKNVFATSIARYVVKKGRLTINPEVVLERSRLLPPRPAGVGFPPRTESVMPTPAETGTPAQTGNLTSPENVASKLTSKLHRVQAAAATDSDDSWTWDDMERERLHGLQLASHFSALEGLQDEVRSGEVLGQYSDWF